MRRLYYLSKKINYVKAISDDLHKAGISDWNFHIVARDEAGLYTHHLHGTGPFQRTDMVHWALRGTLLGLILSLFVVLGLSRLAWSPVAIAAAVMLLTMFCTWACGLVGISHVHYKVARYHTHLEAGEYLIMVDIPQRYKATTEALMERHHGGQACKVGESSTFDNPFESGPLLSYP